MKKNNHYILKYNVGDYILLDKNNSPNVKSLGTIVAIQTTETREQGVLIFYTVELLNYEGRQITVSENDIYVILERR